MQPAEKKVVECDAARVEYAAGMKRVRELEERAR